MSVFSVNYLGDVDCGPLRFNKKIQYPKSPLFERKSGLKIIAFQYLDIRCCLWICKYINLVVPVATVNLTGIFLTSGGEEKHVICICYSSDSRIQWKKWVPNQEQDVSCTRNEMSKTPLNKMMGRLDEKLKNT